MFYSSNRYDACRRYVRRVGDCEKVLVQSLLDCARCGVKDACTGEVTYEIYPGALTVL